MGGAVAARGVVHEAGLLRATQLGRGARAAAGHPAEQGHELAAVAHAEGEGVAPLAEVSK